MVALPTLDCCFEKGNIIVFPQNEMEFLIVKLAGKALNSFQLFSSYSLTKNKLFLQFPFDPRSPEKYFTILPSASLTRLKPKL